MRSRLLIQAEWLDDPRRTLLHILQGLHEYTIRRERSRKKTMSHADHTAEVAVT